MTDPNRFGLLGHGSILTLTSTAIRTSPVQRGKYVMEVLLGTPPPPPPPNVPALPENAESRTGHVAKPLSVRERMEQHRANPTCAGCHKLMDPIGFALENFDAVGVWRTNDSGFRIDPTGQMFDGAKLDGPASLRQAMLNHSDAFLGTFTENLLAYGLGRVLGLYDMPAVRAIERDAARNNNRFSSFVLGIVKSPPFQMRRAEEAEPAATDVMQPDQGCSEETARCSSSRRSTSRAARCCAAWACRWRCRCWIRWCRRRRRWARPAAAPKPRLAASRWCTARPAARAKAPTSTTGRPPRTGAISN